MIEVRVKVFGPLRDIVGGEQFALRVPSPYSGETVFNALSDQYPRLQPWRASVRLAVNLTYAGFDSPLKNGDEIALIPPVSGG
jgi:molybdopterin converting factor small subunit